MSKHLHDEGDDARDASRTRTTIFSARAFWHVQMYRASYVSKGQTFLDQWRREYQLDHVGIAEATNIMTESAELNDTLRSASVLSPSTPRIMSTANSRFRGR